MTERHISRWRLPSERTQAAGSAAHHSSVQPDASSSVSLRYLDEFVRKLQCAPRLLEHQLFPDAKEITESMGLFNAVRRYLIQEPIESPLSTAKKEDDLADGIVVVGDGNTPRSAAMFAYRLKDWKSYSIDPAMKIQSEEEPNGWHTIDNLVVIRNKIENVRIRLKRAVVVLIHAHVTIEQALRAVEAQEIVGVVTMPCCNWYGKQEELFGRHPDVVYDDYSILSDHRELRVWINPRPGMSITDQTIALAVDQSAAMMKGCVRKEFVAGVDPSLLPSANPDKAAKKDKPIASALATIRRVLTASDSHEATMTQTQAAAVATSILSAIPSSGSHVLLLSAPCHHSTLAVELLRSGSTSVYTLAAITLSQDEAHNETLTGDIVKLTVDTETVIGQLRCQASPADTVQPEPIDVSITGVSLDCIVDDHVIYRSLRNHPKKTSGAFFQRLVRFTQSLTASTSSQPQLVVLSPRKDWRKTEFLASSQLKLKCTSVLVPADSEASPPLFVYLCSTANTAAVGNDNDGKEHKHDHKKQLALRLKEALEADFIQLSTTAYTTVHTAKASDATGERVRVRGIVQHLRRFTTGPSFLSIAASASCSFQDHLQVSLDPGRLSRWTGNMTVDAVLRLLHKGDSIEIIGSMDINSQGQSMLRLDAMRFLQSEFQAYQ